MTNNGPADDAFHVRLDKALHDAFALCAEDESNWPELSKEDRRQRDRHVRNLRTLSQALVLLATPKAKLH